MVIIQLGGEAIEVNVLNGKAIRQLRKQKGWSQQELAKAARVDASVISRLERELQEDTKLSVAVSIATALGVSVNSLVNVAKPSGTIAPELQIAIDQLSQQPEHVQRQAAGILQGYLGTL
jgi:transcriptional regulator with XRE-family HTH domain